MRTGASSLRWLGLGLAAALCSCPFVGKLDTMPFLCRPNVPEDCGDEQSCVVEAGKETGHCKNNDGLDCVNDDECLSGRCMLQRCLCGDGELSQGESDVDCGRNCPARCGVGRRCTDNQDCVEGTFCDTNLETRRCSTGCASECQSGAACSSACRGPCGSCPGNQYCDDGGSGCKDLKAAGESCHDGWECQSKDCANEECA